MILLVVRRTMRVILVAVLILGSMGNLPHSIGQEKARKTLMAMEKVVVNAIEETQKSVVAIARVRKGSVGDPTDPEFVPNEFATGVVVDSRGFIVTNYHVLGDIEKNNYYIWASKKPYKVVKVQSVSSVKGADPWTDLAVLQIEADDLKPIRFGDGSKIRKGQFVLSLGNPYAIARDGEPSASWGIVSNLSRKLPLKQNVDGPRRSAQTIHEYGTLIQTDVKLNRGTSGGALLNLNGEMIGLTTSLAAMKQSDTSAGYAIPVDETFKKVVDSLKRGVQPEFGFIGVGLSELDPDAKRDGKYGVRVNQVVKGSPASIAKLAFDDVITKVEDVKLYSSADLMREVSKRFADERVKLTIRKRNGRARATEVFITLSKKFISSERKPYTDVPLPNWRGMSVDYMTAIDGYADIAHLADPNGSVVITKVNFDSPAWKAGLRPRTFITHVNDQRVKNPAEFFKSVEKSNDAVRIKLSDSMSDEQKTKLVSTK